MAQSCPISFNRIDSNLVRIIALQVIVVSLLLLLTNNLIFAYLLLFDFSVRSLNIKKISPFALLANFFLKFLHLQPQLCDEAPKRFALYLGLGIVGFITLLLLFSFTKVAMFLSVILILCATFETLFDYCIGCKIYHLLQILFREH
jgi:hypothetical protein